MTQQARKMLAAELKPCPFCGIAPEIADVPTATSPIVSHPPGDRRCALADKFVLASAWNTRAGLVEWRSIARHGPPEPEVFVLCWDGKETFVDWFGSKPDAGRGVTHWLPYKKPPGATSDMHDGSRAFAGAIDKALSRTAELAPQSLSLREALEAVDSKFWAIERLARSSGQNFIADEIFDARDFARKALRGQPEEQG